MSCLAKPAHTAHNSTQQHTVCVSLSLSVLRTLLSMRACVWSFVPGLPLSSPPSPKSPPLLLRKESPHVPKLRGQSWRSLGRNRSQASQASQAQSGPVRRPNPPNRPLRERGLQKESCRVSMGSEWSGELQPDQTLPR